MRHREELRRDENQSPRPSGGEGQGEGAIVK